jgi:hypothetical protein
VKRTAFTCILLTWVVLALASCNGRPSAGLPATEATPSPALALLTAGQPTARISLPRMPNASAIRLNIQAVTNPGGQGLVIELAIEEPTNTAHQVDIGRVSLYPSNHPGVFTLVLPASAADLVHQASAILIVTLSTALPGDVLQTGIRLSLTAELTRL